MVVMVVLSYVSLSQIGMEIWCGNQEAKKQKKDRRVFLSSIFLHLSRHNEIFKERHKLRKQPKKARNEDVAQCACVCALCCVVLR